MKAYRAYDTLEDPARARAWLYQIAHRVALDEFRRRRIVRFIPWTGESRGAAPSAEHIALEGRFSGDMERALRRMPERQRSALILAELHDLTGLELAAALGVSHVAARAILTRARESLRQALADERARSAESESARPSNGRFTAETKIDPRKALTTISDVWTAPRSCASIVLAPMCGEKMTFFAFRSGCSFPGGSLS